LLLYSSKPSLGVYQLAGLFTSSTRHHQVFWHHHHRHQQVFWHRCRGTKKNNLPRQLGTSKFSGTVAGEEWKTSARGVFAHTSFTLFYCFALLYLFYLHHFLSKTQKK
jgi:hypothetical protein